MATIHPAPRERYPHHTDTPRDCHDGNTLVIASRGHHGHTPSPSENAERYLHHEGTFDAAAWFAAWSDNGGAAMLIGDRLWIGTGSAVSGEAAQALASLRAHLHTRGAREALAKLLRANAGGMR